MPANFSWGIFSLFAWLVPHVSIEVGEFRRSLSESPLWRGGERFQDAKLIVAEQTVLAILVALLIIAGTAIGVALTTDGLDPNMVHIIEGMSLFTSAIFTLVISCKAPEWIGVYYSLTHQTSESLGRSFKALAFNVRWNVWGRFVRVYFCLLPFYCGANAVEIPVSMVAGILFGFLLDYCIYFGRRRREVKPRSRFAFGLAVVVLLISSALFQQGARYIDKVWARNEWKGKQAQLGVVAAVVWFFGALLVHVFLWCQTRRMVKEHGLGEGVRSGYLAPVHTRKGERLATSIVKEMYVSYRTRNRANSASGHTDDMANEEPKLSPVAEENEDDDEEANNVQAESANGENADSEVKEEAQGRCVPSCGEVKGSAVAAPGASENETPDNANQDDKEFDENDPSTCSLLRGKFCGCNRAEFKQRPCLERTVIIVEYIFWVLVALGFTFFTIINIGAQKQVAAVNANLPIAEAAIYTDMDKGAVCAFMEAEHRPNSNITTFPSKESANAEGFKVLHCGACGACSTWENLRMEFWTRNYLAAESARCAKKSLGGGRNAVHECLMKAPIMFDPACSECWTEDIICTKENCAFIYLQSQLINQVANFDVAPGEITSATCEEALCEMDPAPGVQGFVNCSGATRRRMNVQSTIKRPPEQQCNIVEVKWEDLFGTCCENVGDFGPALDEVRKEEGWRDRKF